MKKLFAVGAFLFVLLGILLTCAVQIACQPEVYFSVQEQVGVTEGMNVIELKALRLINQEATDFLKGDSDVITDISERAFYHMKDVKNIVDRAKTAAIAFIVGAGACAVCSLGSGRGLLVSVFLGLFALCAAGCAVFSRMDFHSVFYAFHAFVFENDLWLLDPVEDMMIRVLPEAFFMEMAGRVVRRAALWYALIGGAMIGLLGIKVGKRRV